jgi:photosystem II stability/assembly factor-like uncharacterized protein
MRRSPSLGAQPRVLVVSAALLWLLTAACAASNTGPGETSPSSPSPATPASAAPTAFEPVAASFISPSHGWVLGASGCQDCASLRTTTDGGASWRVLPAPPDPVDIDTSPPAGVSGATFANAADGFLYDPGLLVSHDGGLAWVRAELPPVQELVVAGGYAFALTKAPRAKFAGLYRERLGGSRWTLLKMPFRAGIPSSLNVPNGQVAIYAEGTTLVLLQGGVTGPANTQRTVGNIWVSTTAGTRWQARAVPCKAPAGGGAAVLAIARGHQDAWLLDCYNNEQSSQAEDTQHLLYGTADAGLSWVALADPTSYGMPDLLADNGAGHAFLAVGAPVDVLVGTFDGALAWRTLLQSGGSFSGWNDLQFLTSQVGYVVGAVSFYGKEHLYRTQDGGRTWQAVRFG